MAWKEIGLMIFSYFSTYNFHGNSHILWQVLKKWNVGSNSGLNFQHDKWLMEAELWSLISGTFLKDGNKLKLSDMVQGGSWNVNLHSFHFPQKILLCIKAIPTPRTANHKDSLSWGLSPFREFEGKFAYSLSKGRRKPNYRFSSQWIWKTNSSKNLMLCMKILST